MGVAIGCAARDRMVAFASTFAAFLSRAYDQIRMGAISQTNVNLVGSHCGVSIGNHEAETSLVTWLWMGAVCSYQFLSSGEDGPSQMALEDLAMFRAIPTCTVFYPSDAVSTERAVELSANTKVRSFSHDIPAIILMCHVNITNCFLLRESVSSVPVDQILQ